MNFHKTIPFRRIEQLTRVTIAIFSLTFVLFSCGENNDSNTDLLKERMEEVQNTDRDLVDSPCELLTIEEMANICSVSGEIEITQLAKMYTYPTCVYSWNDGKCIQESSIGGHSTFVVDNNVMIVMVKDASEDIFEISTGVYKDGISVENVGEKAKWGEKMSQLSFLSKGYMFHVNVKILPSSEENKKAAVEIARFLVEKL